MKQYSSTYLMNLKEQVSMIKFTANCLIVGLFALSAIYFAFWILVMSDTNAVISSNNIFLPLAKLLNPGDVSAYIYRSTSLELFTMIIPILFVYGFVDKYEEDAHKRYDNQLMKKQQELLLKAKVKAMHKYDSIREYSICLSADYSDNTKKEVLNSMAFAEIKNVMTSKIPETVTNIVSKNSMVIRSKEFNKYDYTFDVLLKLLAKIKRAFSDSYKVDMFPSITTDAYTSYEDNKAIEKKHFEIQSFDLKNKSVNTATFSKKYQNVNLSRYAGVPIGQYAYFKNNIEDTYELNVVSKNLSNTLDKMITTNRK